MAFGRRQLVVLLLFFLVVSSEAVPVSRSLKTVKNQVSSGDIPTQDVKEIEKVNDVVLEEVVERRMNIELADYPGAGANPSHDPKPPGRV